MNEKPKVINVIASAFCGIIVFGVAYLLVTLIGSGIIYILTLIPILKTIINWLFQIRGDSADMLIVFISALSAYYASKATIFKMSKSFATRNISLITAGSIISIAHLISLVINIATGEWILPNIVQLVAGIALLSCRKNSD